jgi:hypothetical protein
MKEKGKGKKIKRGKNLNPVQQVLGGSWNFGGFPQKMNKINIAYSEPRPIQ